MEPSRDTMHFHCKLSTGVSYKINLKVTERAGRGYSFQITRSDGKTNDKALSALRQTFVTGLISLITAKTVSPEEIQKKLQELGLTEAQVGGKSGLKCKGSGLVGPALECGASRIPPRLSSSVRSEVCRLHEAP